MRQTKLITILAYLFMIAGCMAIVFFINKVTHIGSSTETTESSVEESFLLDEKESQKDVSEGTDTEGLKESEEESKSADSGRRVWYTGKKKRPVNREEIPVQEEEKKGPPKLILATDIHYMSDKTTDYGQAFDRLIARDDGKVLRYSRELTEAFLTEVVKEQPDALILSGDLTVNGEKISHQELSAMLLRVQNEGIPVLVIPGNHDINNPNAATYFGEAKEEAEQVTAEEFYELYRAFGYDEAASRDETSLSYRYVLDDTHWLLMLDSCQYEPYNKVGGKIGDETYVWIREQYEEAAQAGAVMIPVSHHNLMGESRVYPTDCEIEGGEEMISIMGEYQVPLYLSGHLHLQRIKHFQAEPGEEHVQNVAEAVTASLSIAPCQYAMIKWDENDEITYSLKTVDVSGWAAEKRLEDENLRGFEQYSEDLVIKVVSDQIFKKIHSVPDDMKRLMADLYGQLNYEYCMGKKADKREVRESYGYELWEKTQEGSRELSLINKMMADLKEDYTSWSSAGNGDQADS